MAARQSQRRADHWECCFFLIFDSVGNVRLTRTAPGLASNERSMAVTTRIPYTLFQTPSLRATIDITDHVQPLPVIDLTAAGEALRNAIGWDVVMSIKGPE